MTTANRWTALGLLIKMSMHNYSKWLCQNIKVRPMRMGLCNPKPDEHHLMKVKENAIKWNRAGWWGWNFVTHVLIHDSIWMIKNKLCCRHIHPPFPVQCIRHRPLFILSLNFWTKTISNAFIKFIENRKKTDSINWLQIGGCLHEIDSNYMECYAPEGANNSFNKNFNFSTIKSSA